MTDKEFDELAVLIVNQHSNVTFTPREIAIHLFRTGLFNRVDISNILVSVGKLERSTALTMTNLFLDMELTRG